MKRTVKLVWKWKQVLLLSADWEFTFSEKICGKLLVCLHRTAHRRLAYKQHRFHWLPLSQWIYISGHSLAVSNVIVKGLELLWQLLITPLVLQKQAIQHRNSPTSFICQSLSAGDTFHGVWLSIRTELVTMFTCAPSIFLRLIPHRPDWLPSFYFPHFSCLHGHTAARKYSAGLVLTMQQHDSNKKANSFYFLFIENGINILCSRSCSHKGENM